MALEPTPDSCSCSSSETEAAQPNFTDLVKPGVTLRLIDADFQKILRYSKPCLRLCSGFIRYEME